MTTLDQRRHLYYQGEIAAFLSAGNGISYTLVSKELVIDILNQNPTYDVETLQKAFDDNRMIIILNPDIFNAAKDKMIDAIKIVPISAAIPAGYYRANIVPASYGG